MCMLRGVLLVRESTYQVVWEKPITPPPRKREPWLPRKLSRNAVRTLRLCAKLVPQREGQIHKHHHRAHVSMSPKAIIENAIPNRPTRRTNCRTRNISQLNSKNRRTNRRASAFLLNLPTKNFSFPWSIDSNKPFVLSLGVFQWFPINDIVAPVPWFTCGLRVFSFSNAAETWLNENRKPIHLCIALKDFSQKKRSTGNNKTIFCVITTGLNPQRDLLKIEPCFAFWFKTKKQQKKQSIKT